MFNKQTPDQQEFDLPPLSHVTGLSASQPSEALPSIAGYRIIGSLGAGAMGTVWRAWQISTRREVALKLMATSAIGSGKARQRFEREVELTSQLEHPGIARLYDSGVYQNLYYYAMELVEGNHLDTYVKTRALSQPEILKLCYAICLALQHAHERGVIHRDLKPSNILVDVKGQPHVVDFGLAKREGVAIDSPLISLNGDIAGTPAFMSPEQAAGKTNGLDTRSDVYSLGVILYLLLTGKFPLNTSGSYVDVLHRVANDEALPPRKISRAVGRDLQKIIMKAISKLPEDRYSNAGALAADIDNYLHCEPVSAQAPTLPYVLKKKLWKHKVFAAIGGSAITIVATISIYASIQIRAERNTALTAAARESIQRKEADLATALSDLRLADTSLNLGDQLIRDGQWPAAKPRFSLAKQIYRRLGKSEFLTDVGLLECFHHSPSPLVHLESKKDRFVSFSVSQDSTSALGVTAQGALSCYGIPRGEQLVSLRPLTGVLVNVVPIDDGRAVAMAISNDSMSGRGPPSTLYLQREDQQSPYLKLPLLDWQIAHVAISPDVHSFAALCVENTTNQLQQKFLVLGDLTGKKSIRIIDNHATAINAMDFSLDGSHLVTADFECKVKQWDLNTFTASQLVNDAFSRPIGLICLPNNNMLIATGDGSLLQWDLDLRRQVRSLISDGPETTALALSKDHSLIADGDTVGAIRVWSESTGALIGCFENHQTAVTSLSFSPDGRTLSSTNRDGSATIWPVPGRYGSVSVKLDGEVAHISISPHHRLSLMGLRNGACILSDTISGSILCTLESDRASIFDVGFSPDASQAIITHEDGTILTYSLPSGNLSSSLNGLLNSQYSGTSKVHRSQILRASILAPDARSALEISSTEVILRDTTTGDSHVVAGPSMKLGGFSNDGDYAFVVDSNRQITLIRVRDAAAIGFMQGDGDPPTCGAISSHGKRVLLGSSDGTLTLLDLQVGKQLWSINLHGGIIRSISFCSNDHATLVNTENGSAQLWDIDNQRILNKLECNGMNISSASISPDEHMIAAQAAGNPMQFWNLDCADVEAEKMEYPHDLPGNISQRASPDASNGLAYAALGFDAWALNSFEAVAPPSDPFSAFTWAGAYWRHADLIAAAKEYKRAKALSNTTEDQVYADLCIQAITSSSRKTFFGKQ